MKILKIFGIIVIVAVVLLFVAYLMMPSEGHLERSISINAPAKSIFKEVSSFKNFNNWSPWHKLDPETEYSYTGPASGEGAKMSWSSDVDEVGTGSQEIIGTVPNESVSIQMQFGDFEGDYKAGYILEADGENTKVTWTYDGKDDSAMGKMMNTFVDSFLGPMYEQGLADLKSYVESKPTYAIDITEEEVEAMAYLGTERYVKWEEMEVFSDIMGQSFGKVMGYMASSGIEQSGAPMALYTNFEEGVGMNMEVAIPVAEGTEGNGKDITSGNTYSGKAVKAVHMGDYASMESSYEEITKYMTDNGYGEYDSTMEVYVTDPGEVTDTTQWVTHIYVALN
ncbi:MAG: SRPBCC family protein [Cyclobacteriaceae bacterium]